MGGWVGGLVGDACMLWSELVDWRKGREGERDEIGKMGGWDRMQERREKRRTYLSKPSSSQS